MENAEEEMQRLLDSAQRGPTEPFEVGGVQLAPERVEALLRPHMTEARWEGIRRVVAGRTYEVATVVEGLINTGNVSAVMRSAEALGCQRFHIITGGGDFKHSQRTSRGAEKWLDVWRWDDPASCAAHLREHGYRIVATHLSDEAVPIDEIDFTQRTALVFGNEVGGVSEDMLREADQQCIVPTSGFVESFNISVAAAISLYHARQDRLRRQGEHADLTADQQAALRARFCLRSVNRAEEILRRAVAEGGGKEGTKEGG